MMQAKALRSAVDSGFEVRPSVIERAIRDVREQLIHWFGEQVNG